MKFPAAILYYFLSLFFFFLFRKDAMWAITAIWNGIDILPMLVIEHIKRKYYTKIKLLPWICFKITNWEILQINEKSF